MFRRRRRRYSALCRWSSADSRWLLVSVVFASSPGAERKLRARARSEFGDVAWRLFTTRGFACDVVERVGWLLPPGHEPVVWGFLCPELLR